MLDLLMMVLLLAGFAGAAAYILVCREVTRPAQPIDPHPK